VPNPWSYHQSTSIPIETTEEASQHLAILPLNTAITNHRSEGADADGDEDVSMKSGEIVAE
jgi:hypothetical protein